LGNDGYIPKGFTLVPGDKNVGYHSVRCLPQHLSFGACVFTETPLVLGLFVNGDLRRPVGLFCRNLDQQHGLFELHNENQGIIWQN
jgi:hypothetical protein